MNKRTFLITLIFWSFRQLVFAQISDVALLTVKPMLYKKTEFNISLKAQWVNPYFQQDIALDIVFTTPSGKKLTLPCYYDSGRSGEKSLWKARFAPQEKGRYRYAATLREGANLISTSKTANFIVKPSDGNGILHVKNNWVMQFDNGKPFRGLGENIGWESRASDDSKFFKALHEDSKYNYEYMLRSLASHGGNFFRTWIAAFNLPVDWQKPVNSNRYKASDDYFNPSAIVKMDRLVVLCDSLHLHMMLTLGQGAFSVRTGGFSPTSADFFVNPKSKQRYKDRLRYFIARWGYSPAIGVWELFNEVDNVQFANKTKPISPDSIVQWHNEMSTYLKKSDPFGHPVTTSISHRDLKGLNTLPNIDINQKHIYKNTASIPKNIESYENDFHKPYVIGEYSYEWDWSKNFDDFAPEMDSDYKRGLWYGLFSPTPILPMSWWWEYFDNRKTDIYLARVRLIMNKMLSAGSGNFEKVPVKDSDTSVIDYSVKCGDKIFVYVFNPITKPTEINLTLSQSFPDYDLVVYNCENGLYQSVGKGQLIAGKPVINNWPLAAQTDAIFILSKKSTKKSL